MARPANPTPRWDGKEWIVRVTVNGVQERHGLPDIPENEPKLAAQVAKDFSDRLRAGDGVAADGSETVAAWARRRYRWLATRPRVETLDQRKAKWVKWVNPVLGPVAIRAVDADDVRRLVQSLEDAVSAETIAAKTAINIWAEVTRAFADSCEANDATIRVRKDNPCDKVRGPERGDLRTKPFLRPHEIVTLLSCEDVPCYRRELYAVAIYTAGRIGEIRALTPGDVDLDAMQLTIAKQADRFGEVKGKTKTRKARMVRIEPSLLPLLRVLVARKGKTLLDIINEDHAGMLRADLHMANVRRPALFVDDALRMPLTFHGLRDTCLSHMAVRRDPPQDVQWRAGHTTGEMTERYIAAARYEAGDSFGTPFPPLPDALLETARGEVTARFGGFIGSRREYVGEAVRRSVSADEAGFQSKTPRFSVNLCEGGDLNPYANYGASTSS